MLLTDEGRTALVSGDDQNLHTRLLVLRFHCDNIIDPHFIESSLSLEMRSKLLRNSIPLLV